MQRKLPVMAVVVSPMTGSGPPVCLSVCLLVFTNLGSINSGTRVGSDGSEALRGLVLPSAANVLLSGIMDPIWVCGFREVRGFPV